MNDLEAIAQLLASIGYTQDARAIKKSLGHAEDAAYHAIERAMKDGRLTHACRAELAKLV